MTPFEMVIAFLTSREAQTIYFFIALFVHGILIGLPFGMGFELAARLRPRWGEFQVLFIELVLGPLGSFLVYKFFEWFYTTRY